jgi:tetratricopeptide (TPR) repeat protein
VLEYADLMEVLRALDREPTETELQRLLLEMDPDRSGTISYREFLEGMLRGEAMAKQADSTTLTVTEFVHCLGICAVKGFDKTTEQEGSLAGNMQFTGGRFKMLMMSVIDPPFRGLFGTDMLSCNVTYSSKKKKNHTPVKIDLGLEEVEAELTALLQTKIFPHYSALSDRALAGDFDGSDSREDGRGGGMSRVTGGGSMMQGMMAGIGGAGRGYEMLDRLSVDAWSLFVHDCGLFKSTNAQMAQRVFGAALHLQRKAQKGEFESGQAGRAAMITDKWFVRAFTLALQEDWREEKRIENLERNDRAAVGATGGATGGATVGANQDGGGKGSKNLMHLRGGGEKQAAYGLQMVAAEAWEMPVEYGARVTPKGQRAREALERLHWLYEVYRMPVRMMAEYREVTRLQSPWQASMQPEWAKTRLSAAAAATEAGRGVSTKQEGFYSRAQQRGSGQNVKTHSSITSTYGSSSSTMQSPRAGLGSKGMGGMGMGSKGMGGMGMGGRLPRGSSLGMGNTTQFSNQRTVVKMRSMVMDRGDAMGGYDVSSYASMQKKKTNMMRKIKAKHIMGGFKVPPKQARPARVVDPKKVLRRRRSMQNTISSSRRIPQPPTQAKKRQPRSCHRAVKPGYGGMPTSPRALAFYARKSKRQGQETSNPSPPSGAQSIVNGPSLGVEEKRGEVADFSTCPLRQEQKERFGDEYAAMVTQLNAVESASRKECDRIFEKSAGEGWRRGCRGPRENWDLQTRASVEREEQEKNKRREAEAAKAADAKRGHGTRRASFVAQHVHGSPDGVKANAKPSAADSAKKAMELRRRRTPKHYLTQALCPQASCRAYGRVALCNEFTATCNMIVKAKAKGEERVARMNRQRMKLVEVQSNDTAAKAGAAAKIAAAASVGGEQSVVLAGHERYVDLVEDEEVKRRLSVVAIERQAEERIHDEPVTGEPEERSTAGLTGEGLLRMQESKWKAFDQAFRRGMACDPIYAGGAAALQKEAKKTETGFSSSDLAATAEAEATVAETEAVAQLGSAATTAKSATTASASARAGGDRRVVHLEAARWFEQALILWRQSQKFGKEYEQIHRNGATTKLYASRNTASTDAGGRGAAKQEEEAAGNERSASKPAVPSYFQVAKADADQAAAARQECAVLAAVGLAYKLGGRYDLALRVLREHLSMVQAYTHAFDWRVEGPALSNLANCYHQLHEFELAQEKHHQRLALAQRHGDMHGEMVSHTGMGNAFAATGGVTNLERALRHRRRAVELARRLPVTGIPMPRELAGTCRNLGLSLLHSCKAGYLGTNYDDSCSSNKQKDVEPSESSWRSTVKEALALHLEELQIQLQIHTDTDHEHIYPIHSGAKGRKGDNVRGNAPPLVLPLASFSRTPSSVSTLAIETDLASPHSKPKDDVIPPSIRRESAKRLLAEVKAGGDASPADGGVTVISLDSGVKAVDQVLQFPVTSAQNLTHDVSR